MDQNKIRLEVVPMNMSNDPSTRYAACAEHAGTALKAMDISRDRNEMVVARDVKYDDHYLCACGKQARWFFITAVIEED